MKRDPKALYHPLILRHNKQPFHFEKKEDAAIRLDAYNPICGDRFTLYLDLENDRIEQLHFHGYGCAVSKAATSVMITHLTGKTVAEALRICEHYELTLESGQGETEDFIPFSVSRHFPGREACATLSWQELKKFLLEE